MGREKKLLIDIEINCWIERQCQTRGSLRLGLYGGRGGGGGYTGRKLTHPQSKAGPLITKTDPFPDYVQ